MSGTMGMQVELLLTAKGMTANLKNAQGEIVQTVNILKNQLPKAADEAGKGFAKFKTEIGRSSSAMMFFTRSLGELGPGGQTAQIALSGLGGMLMGGGVVGLGLAAAQVGMRLLGDALGESSEATAKFRVELQQAADESKRRLADLAIEIEKVRLASTGLSSEQIVATMAQKKSADEFQRAAVTVASLREEIAELRANPYIGSENRIAGLQMELTKWEANLAAASAYRNQMEVLRAMQAEEGRAAQAGLAQKAMAGIIKATPAPKKKPTKDVVGFEGFEDEGRALDDLRTLEAADFAKGLAAADKATKEMEANAKRIASAYAQMGQSMGESIGTAFAGMITGAQSVRDAMAGMLKSIVNTVIEAVKTQVMANAVAASAEAAKSQAGIPVVGPILAGAAMVAMLSMVQGLVGSIPSSAGGLGRVPNDTFAYIHKDETVLPAALARTYRDLAAGGGGRGGAPVFNVSALDGRSVERVFSNNDSQVMRAMRKMQRRIG